MEFKILFVLKLLFIISTPSEQARILGVFPFEGRSHFIMFKELFKELAARGHEVVVISHWPQKTPLPRYTDRSLRGSRTIITNNLSTDFIQENLGFWSVIDFILEYAGTTLCEEMFRQPVIQDLIQSNEKFDLLINELWGSDCFLGLAHKFNVPHISMTTTIALPWGMARYGNPFNPAFETTYFSHYKTSGMNFKERVLNTILVTYLNIRHYFDSEIPSDVISRKYLGPSTPPLREIIQNSSALFINSHFSVNGARPFVPNVIEVGGMHIAKPKPLPEDIQTFLDNSKRGAIFISFGSLVKTESFSKEKIDGLVEAFKELPYNILWKFGGNVANPPPNVKISNWFPQRDILLHPKVKLFVTHGGLMGTQEAIQAGVPMVVVPFFGDQQFNAVNYVDLGFAEILPFEKITKINFLKTVNTVLNDEKYAESMNHYSAAFNDRPMSALDTGVYWVEYILRHKDRRHLHSAVKKLNWFQSSLWDVYLFIIICLYLVMYFAYKILSFSLNVLSYGSEKVKTT